MARLDSWLSTDVMHALGWALIHSLWQCLGLAALAAILMAFSRRPSIRYLVGITALVAMLAAPVATFLVLMKHAAPIHALLAANSRPQLVDTAATPPSAMSITLDAAPKAMNSGVTIALVDSPKQFLPSRLLAPDFIPPNILPWLVSAWLCGVALFSLRFAGGLLLLENKRRRQSRAPRPRILAACQELQRQLGLTRAIRYLECGWLQAPGVIGWMRPIVLLPVAALTGLSEAQLRAVIAHELAHIRRHDSFVNLVQILIETLLFYHPAIWWLNRRIRAERELCCDEIAVSLTGNRLEYAKALTLMEEWEKAPALAMAANRGPLSERIFHILGRKPLGAGQRMLGLTGSVMFLAAALGAANALFGIAYPIPVAHADTNLKAALPSSQSAVDQMAQMSEPMANDISTGSGNHGAGRETVASGQIEAAANSQAEKPVTPSPDMSRQLPDISQLVTPVRIAANDPPIAPAQPAPQISPAVALNDQSDNQPGAAKAAPAANASECAPPQLVNSVAMEKVPGSDVMMVAATIDGSPQKMLFDIGREPSQLWNAQAAKLHLAVQERRPYIDFGGRFSQGAARVENFSFGAMQSGGFHIQVSPDPDVADAPFAGIIGNDMMWRYDVDLDFAHQKLNVFTPEQCKGAGVYWSPSTITSVPIVAYTGIEYSNHTPGIMVPRLGATYVPVTLDGHAIIALLDTSAERTFLNPDVASKLFGIDAGSSGSVNVTDGGTLIKAQMHTFSNLTFGGLAANHPQIAIPLDITTQSTNIFHASKVARDTYSLHELMPDLVIGMDVLRHSHLYVSFRNDRVYISAAGDGAALNAQPTGTTWFNIY